MALLLIPACDLMPFSGNSGNCSPELFDIVQERGFAPIMIDLVMEEYVPRSQLNEDEWREQRKEIIELQHEFLHILEGNDFKIEAIKKGSEPWLSMEVDEQALLFICNHEMVKTVNKIRTEDTQ